MQGITKKQQAARELFKAEVVKWLLSVGAVASDVPVGALGFTYDYRLETTLGMLHVTPNDTWVACRWDDVERALATIGPDGMNRHSGKWNHHFADEYFKTDQKARQAAFYIGNQISRYL